MKYSYSEFRRICIAYLHPSRRVKFRLVDFQDLYKCGRFSKFKLSELDDTYSKRRKITESPLVIAKEHQGSPLTLYSIYEINILL